MIKFRGPQGPWEPVFVWRPIRDIHGRRHWLKSMFRRERNRMVWPPHGWEYGTALDVLRDAG
jgi:SH3-like domain-containing protein